jgi:phosphoribosylformimino-5-aminoimidazole carboxamide ribotide isomerase
MVAHPTADPHQWPIAVIPVIDVLREQVVHAKAGQRDCYAPIHSPLVEGSDPVAVLRALLNLSQAKTAYIADLDGIMLGAPQWPLIHSLAQHFSDIAIWLDAGFTSFEQTQAIPSFVFPVLGTETLRDLNNLSLHSAECVLSLDFGPEGFRGDPRWLSCPEYWPSRVIVMSLAKVGANSGPDMERIQTTVKQARSLAHPPQIFAAGGVAVEHANALSQLGVAGALVASALHK